jgi:sulfonate transport system ATP-binding protein
VRENVAYGMQIKHFPGDRINQRVDYMLDLVGLTDTRDLYPNQVSASMVQRITVARAFAVDPDLLLMDEPYGQLDVKLRYYLEDDWSSCGRRCRARSSSSPTISRRPCMCRTHTGAEQQAHEHQGRSQDRPATAPSLIDPNFVAIRKQVTELIRWW